MIFRFIRITSYTNFNMTLLDNVPSKCDRTKMVCIGIGFTALVVLVVVAIIYFQNVNAVEYKTVETNYGKVRGRMHKTFLKQKPYFAFKGIPFAKPPIGADRFKVRWEDFCREIQYLGKVKMHYGLNTIAFKFRKGKNGFSTRNKDERNLTLFNQFSDTAASRFMEAKNNRCIQLSTWMHADSEAILNNKWRLFIY